MPVTNSPNGSGYITTPPKPLPTTASINQVPSPLTMAPQAMAPADTTPSVPTTPTAPTALPLASVPPVPGANGAVDPNAYSAWQNATSGGRAGEATVIDGTGNSSGMNGPVGDTVAQAKALTDQYRASHPNWQQENQQYEDSIRYGTPVDPNQLTAYQQQIRGEPITAPLQSTSAGAKAAEIAASTGTPRNPLSGIAGRLAGASDTTPSTPTASLSLAPSATPSDASASVPSTLPLAVRRVGRGLGWAGHAGLDQLHDPARPRIGPRRARADS
jgi:hypothetical protein